MRQAQQHRTLPVLALLLSVTAAAVGAPAETAPTTRPAGPTDTSAWIGTNYTPAYAANQVQMWHDFRPDVIDRELAAARRHFAINTLRVYLHYINFREEKDKLLARIEQFLVLCDKHSIRPGFTFFDDCWNHKDVALDTPPPVPGRHNGRWAAVQDADRKDANLPLFRSYVREIVTAHARDKRVLWWEVYNEPNRKDPFTRKLCELGYRWASECSPDQPILCCWDDNPQTEIVNAHNYGDDFAPGGAWDRQADLKAAKGTVFTEAGARWYAGKPASNGSPVEVVRWLRSRRERGKTVPGVYLCWELMAGNSHCRWYWGTKDGAAEPPIPWCGLLMPDCTPVSYAEAEAVRSYATARPRALLFEDFHSAPPPADPPGWRRFQHGGHAASGTLTLEGSAKLVAGQEQWTDYLLEATVMLKADTGNAGLIFRVTTPGPGADQMRGYYAGLDRTTLYLGRMENNWRELARVDLTKTEPKVQLGAWNLLRVAMQDGRIRVWLNPLAGDTRPRIELTDKNPIPRGAVGLRVHSTTACFDDVVALPIDVLTTQSRPGPD